MGDKFKIVEDQKRIGIGVLSKLIAESEYVNRETFKKCPVRSRYLSIILPHKLFNKCDALLKERQDGTELKITRLLPSSTLHTLDSTNTPKYPEQRPVETKMSNKIAKAANNKK